MPAKSFLRLVNGVINLVSATVMSSGAANDGDLVALDATGRLDSSLMPIGYGSETVIVQASEALAAGAMVNVYDVTGATRARNADASTTGKEAHGFVLAAVAANGNATVYFARLNTSLSGLTNGVRYYLSAAAPGAITVTPVSGAGRVHQYLGRAVSTTSLAFEPEDPIYLT